MPGGKAGDLCGSSTRVIGGAERGRRVRGPWGFRGGGVKRRLMEFLFSWERRVLMRGMFSRAAKEVDVGRGCRWRGEISAEGGGSCFCGTKNVGSSKCVKGRVTLLFPVARWTVLASFTSVLVTSC